jgi:hypothetical protein
MRRFRLALLLPLLLVFAQHGAVLHQLGHLSYASHAISAQVHADDPLLDSSLCLSCEAFAQVTNPAGSAAVSVPLLTTPRLIAPEPAPYAASVEVLTPRSRGPPLS